MQRCQLVCPSAAFHQKAAKGNVRGICWLIGASSCCCMKEPDSKDRQQLNARENILCSLCQVLEKSCTLQETHRGENHTLFSTKCWRKCALQNSRDGQKCANSSQTLGKTHCRNLASEINSYQEEKVPSSSYVSPEPSTNMLNTVVGAKEKYLHNYLHYQGTVQKVINL